MKLSAVCCGRNDNYGGHLLESAVYSLNSMLQSFDEVIYVDWNTEEGKKTVAAELESKLTNVDRLRVIEVTPAQVKKIMGDAPAQPMCEVMARNVGIRRATGDVVVSTNIDIIAPPREQLELAFRDMKPGMMLTLAKHDVELEDLTKIFGETVDVQERMPLVFGLWPMQKRLMSPHLAVTKDVLDANPVSSHHTLASVICACGDFQAAHRDTWHTIKGFEEEMKKRLYADTTVQYQVIMSGGVVYASNFPPVYHIEHARYNSPDIANSPEMNPITKNDDNWGLKGEIDM